MSFPLIPIDGYEYASPDGIKFIYNSSKNAWDVKVVLELSDEFGGSVVNDANEELNSFNKTVIWNAGNASSPINLYNNIGEEWSVGSLTNLMLIDLSSKVYNSTEGVSPINLYNNIGIEWSVGSPTNLMLLDPSPQVYNSTEGTSPINLYNNIGEEWNTGLNLQHYYLNDHNQVSDFSIGLPDYYVTLIE